MKKLGKSLSFLTKIMLVIGLLISNLSSLSVVFAYEATDAIEITVVDDKLNIKYSSELAEEVENVNVNVYENYTYLDNTSIEEVVNNYNLTSEELMDSEGYEVVSVLSSVVFDGLYEVKVEITDTLGEEIDSAIYSENIVHESGLNFKLLDNANNEIIPVDGVYSIKQDNSSVKVVAQVLAGGLKPSDIFMYDDMEYFAEELLTLEFSSDTDFNGRLYGEYTLPVEVKLLNADLEEVVYTEELNVMYESYAMNDLTLNNGVDTLGLGEMYEFFGDSKDGILYVLLDSEKSNTVLNLYNLMNSVYGTNDIVSYVVSNSEYEDVISAYDETVLGVSLEEYLGSILLDDTTSIKVMNDGLTVTYKVVIIGDTNNDNVISSEDLMLLVDQVVGVEETDLEKSDLYNDDSLVNVLDVMYLSQVIKTGIWEVTLEEIDATVDASLVVNGTDIVSGDEFTIDYVVSLTDYAVNGVSGLFSYDDTMLELVSLKVNNEWSGNSKDGKFLFLGEESLTGVVTELESGEVVVEAAEYVLVTATFKALKSGESNVTVEELEYFDQNKYLVVTDAVEPVLIVVNASDNNNLSSLTVAGQVIELTEGVLDYEITVGNDVTVADVEAIVENVAANITSLVYPEELVEGANIVTITVTSESGDVKVYTVTVNKEAAPEEETATTTTQVNYNNYNDEDETEEVTKPIEEETTEEEIEDDVEVEEESNLSRIVIIILILLVIAGLIYLIFKDEDDEETKKANKEVNRLRKKEEDLDVRVEKNTSKTTNKSNNNNNNTKKTNNKKK